MLGKYKEKYKGKILQQDGTAIPRVLNNVLHIPDPQLHLISITKSIKAPHIYLTSKGELVALQFQTKIKPRTMN